MDLNAIVAHSGLILEANDHRVLWDEFAARAPE